MDSDEYALLVPASQGHRSDPGGGQLPSPTVLPLQDSVAVEGPEWDAQTHSILQSKFGA